MADELAAHRNFLKMVTGFMGAAIVEAKVECPNASEAHVTLCVAGRAGMLAHMFEVVVPVDEPLLVAVDADSAGYFCGIGLHTSVAPSCVLIDAWESSRGDALMNSDVSLDAAYFNDPSAPFPPFDMGVVGGHTQEKPEGIGTMRMTLRNVTDRHQVMIIAISGSVVHEFGCRFHADGPLYTPDLTRIVETEMVDADPEPAVLP